jgi:hypothetical protein
MAVPAAAFANRMGEVTREINAPRSATHRPRGYHAPAVGGQVVRDLSERDVLGAIRPGMGPVS